MHILIEKPPNNLIRGTVHYDNFQFMIDNYLAKVKYQVMWNLRSIEKEIEKEGGTIIIRKFGKVDLTGFSPALSQQILALIAEGIKQGHWG